MEVSIFDFTGNFASIFFQGLGGWPITQKRNTLSEQSPLFRLVWSLFSWISSNFGQTDFIEGIHKIVKMDWSIEKYGNQQKHSRN